MGIEGYTSSQKLHEGESSFNNADSAGGYTRGRLLTCDLN